MLRNKLTSQGKLINKLKAGAGDSSSPYFLKLDQSTVASSTYATERSPADAFRNPQCQTYSKTSKGIGQSWQISLKEKSLVGHIRVRTYPNQGLIGDDRLRNTKVLVDGQLCGQFPPSTTGKRWYKVTCSKPIFGTTIKLVTTSDINLSLSGIEAYKTRIEIMGRMVKAKLMKSTAKASSLFGEQTAADALSDNSDKAMTITNVGKG